MTKHFALPHQCSSDSVMQRVGYAYHCGRDGKPCYHRQLNDPKFPRFHAYVVEKNGRMVIDLHFDADDVTHHRSNHDQSWAYHGGRVELEMQRISDLLEGRPAAHVAGIERLQKSTQPKQAPKNLFDLLFR